MDKIEFLGLDDILDIHRDQIEHYGGSAGVRDMGLLQSAVAMPVAAFGDQYLHKDISEMAAAYLFHITQNHPFIDGNKRTGAVAAIVFLAMNNFELSANEDELENLVRDIATGQSNKDAAADFFRKNTSN